MKERARLELKKLKAEIAKMKRDEIRDNIKLFLYFFSVTVATFAVFFHRT